MDMDTEQLLGLLALALMLGVFIGRHFNTREAYERGVNDGLIEAGRIMRAREKA